MHTLGIAGDFLPSCADGRSDARPRPSMCVSFERFILRKSISPLPWRGRLPVKGVPRCFHNEFSATRRSSRWAPTRDAASLSPAHETAHRDSAISLTAKYSGVRTDPSASRRSRGGYHRPSRRRLIVMFLDLANSTRLAEEMGELRAHDLPRTVAWSRRRPRGRANSEADQDDFGRSGAARFPWIVE